MVKKINNDTNIALINQSLVVIAKDVQEIKDKIEKNYVSKEELELERQRIRNLEKIVYGMVALILIAICGAVIQLVILK